MPRIKASAGSRSAFRQVQRQAQALLAGLRKEIHNKEMELNRLKVEASSLSALVGRGGAMVGLSSTAASKASSSNGGGGRVNWRTVLTQVPKQFKASDVRDVRGLKNKRPSEIFAAITRWIDGGMAKRKARGVYERV
jgi:hypothetical protein